MSLLSKLECTQCQHVYEPDAYITTCTRCGGIIHIHYDLQQAKEELNVRRLQKRPPGVWKYFEILPLRERRNIVTLGEGGTYLHKCNRLAKEIGIVNLYLKDETKNPTGAFIDRGTTVEISAAKEHRIKTICCGSTGNLAASVVAYAARADIKSRVFIDQEDVVDIGKFYQILAHADDIEIVRSHEEAEARTAQEARTSHCVAGCNPHFLEGEKTTVFEICEQLDWTTPDWLVIPMGNGGHISMTWKGLKELEELGFISETHTKLVGAQAKGCAPIVEAFERGDRETIPPKKTSTIAYDIGMKNPLSGHTALAAIKSSGGAAVAVSDKQILEAVRSLAKLEGVFAEPSSATTISAIKELVKSGVINRKDTVVCTITGMGLKYPETARSFAKGQDKLEHLLSRVEGRRVTTELGQTKVHILSILSEGELYGYAIWKALRENYGVHISVPSVYQHLTELMAGGLILTTHSEETLKRTHRKYYALTERGRWTLEQLKSIGSVS
ncbi:threonine synthase [Candidatus Thorarchaeota archaeon]|nr:MAG: threonine synthase [Candidatus Thorarchaeota archaeon]